MRTEGWVATGILASSLAVGYTAAQQAERHELQHALRIEWCARQAGGTTIDKATAYCLQDLNLDNHLDGMPVYGIPQGEPVQKVLDEAVRLRLKADSPNYDYAIQGFGGTAICLTVLTGIMVTARPRDRARKQPGPLPDAP